MADGFPILSAGSCSCSVTCGGPPPPKYFRAIYRWERSTLLASIGHSTNNRAGRSLSISSTRHGQLVQALNTLTVSGTYLGRWDMEYLATYQCVDFVQNTYGVTAHNTQGSYLRATNTATTATLDFNIGLWKTNNPSGTATDVTLYTGTWYNHWLTGNIARFVNVSNCSTFTDKMNAFAANPCNSTSSYIACCEYCDLAECRNCGNLPGETVGSLICSCYGNDDDCCWTFGPAGLTGRTGAWYGGPYGWSFTYDNIYGNAAGTDITLELTTYDRDPNTAGAQKLYDMPATQVNVNRIYDATTYSYLRYSVSAIDGNFTLTAMG